MGIPLSNMPQIRAFYGKDVDAKDPIDFLEEEYPKITKHVLAARITAENPDEGFKPTSVRALSFSLSSASCVGVADAEGVGRVREGWGSVVVRCACPRRHLPHLACALPSRPLPQPFFPAPPSLLPSACHLHAHTHSKAHTQHILHPC
eukprot:2995709-Rhodomonas_salina.2